MLKRNPFSHYGLLAALVLWCFQASAVTETLTLTHKDIDQPLAFTVTLPANYSADNEHGYMVLFDFHPMANRYLEGLHFWLNHNGQAPWPSTIIVTPEPGNAVGQLFAPEQEHTRLIDYIAQVVMPAVDEKYPTNGFRLFNGYRYNGTLALSMLANHPEAFDAYFVASPELKDNYAKVLSQTKASLPNISTTAFVYLTYGKSIKSQHNHEAINQYITLLQEHAPNSITLVTDDISKHHYMSYPVITLIQGLEQVFSDINDGLSPTSAIAQAGPSAIVAHYQALSKYKYGFDISPIYSLQNRTDYLLEHTPKQAKVFGEYLTTHYSEQAYSWYYQAKIDQALGQWDAAIRAQTKAVALSESMLTWHHKRMVKYLAQLKTHRSVE